MLRDRLHTVVSVVTLALGIACFLAAYLFVSHMQSYDRQFQNADRIYAVYQRVSRERGFTAPWSIGSGRPIAEQIRIDIPEVEAVARLRRTPTGPVTVGGKTVQARVAYAEAGFLDVFDLKTVAGDLESALRFPRGAIVTEAAALKLFGHRDVVGDVFTLNRRGRADLTVRAVIADLPSTSHLGDGLFGQGIDVLASWDVEESIVKAPPDDLWLNGPVVTYVLLPKRGALSVPDLDARLAALVKAHMPSYGGTTISLDLRPVTSISRQQLQAQFEGFYGAWGIDVLNALLAFAAGILALACMNFVNLATAHSLGRAREIGARKAVGASAALLTRQELTHTALLTAAALSLALIIVAPATKLLQGPWQEAASVPWSEPRLWVALGTLLVVVTLAAGAYPALLLARAHPVIALRGTTGTGPAWLRTLLVSVQFAAASFLIIAVAVSFAQNERSRSAVLGRFTDPYVTLGDFAGTQPMTVDPAVLHTELLRGRGVKGATASSLPPMQNFAFGQVVSRSPGEASTSKLVMTIVGSDYFKVMEMPLLAGRTFSADRQDDVFPLGQEQFRDKHGPSHVVIDDAAARSLGWTDPTEAIGEQIYLFGNSDLVYEVIGVVATVQSSIRATDTVGATYAFNPRYASYVIVRISKNDVQTALAHLDDVVDELLPDHPPAQKTFFDEAFASAYWTFTTIGRVFTGLALFAIAISAIALFGTGSFMAERRKREIGIRKSQGATQGQILRLLLWDFSKPVVLANILVWPVAFYAVERYLAIFAERVTLTPTPFLMALTATLLLAWLTVGAAVLRAARLRPTAVLRNE